MMNMPTLLVVGAGLFGSQAAAYARTRGIPTMVFDPGTIGAASPAAAGLFKEQWAGRKLRHHFHPAMTLLDQLYGIRRVDLTHNDGRVEEFHCVPSSAILDSDPIRAAVTAVGDGWLEAGGARYEGWVYLAAGIWSAQFLPGLKVYGKSGTSLVFAGERPGRIVDISHGRQAIAFVRQGHDFLQRRHRRNGLHRISRKGDVRQGCKSGTDGGSSQAHARLPAVHARRPAISTTERAHLACDRRPQDGNDHGSRVCPQIGGRRTLEERSSPKIIGRPPSRIHGRRGPTGRIRIHGAHRRISAVRSVVRDRSRLIRLNRPVGKASRHLRSRALLWRGAKASWPHVGRGECLWPVGKPVGGHGLTHRIAGIDREIEVPGNLGVAETTPGRRGSEIDLKLDVAPDGEVSPGRVAQNNPCQTGASRAYTKPS